MNRRSAGFLAQSYAVVVCISLASIWIQGLGRQQYSHIVSGLLLRYTQSTLSWCTQAFWEEEWCHNANGIPIGVYTYTYTYVYIYIMYICIYIFSIYVYNMIYIHPSINLSLAFLPGLTGLRPGCSGGEWPENVQNVRMPEAWQESNIWSRTQKPRMLEISANQTTKTWSSEPQPRVSPNLSWARLGPKQAGWRAGRFGEARGGVSWAQETRHPQDRHVGGVGETPRRIITIYLNHIWIYLCKERYTKLKQDDLSKHMFKVFIERMERRINMDPFCYTYNKYILLLCN